MARKTTMLQVRNWRKFQHYNNRTPPWIKLHWELLSSEDWVSLDDASKLLAVACMLIASRNDGLVPDNPAYIKRVAYLDQTPNLKPLIECGFLENQLADDSGSKQKQADATPETETELEKEKESKKEGGAVAQTEYAFVGDMIRLKTSDLLRWRMSFHAIPDIEAELTAADAYYRDNPPEGGKWFFPVSNWLKRAHQDALTKRVQEDDACPDSIYAGVH